MLWVILGSGKIYFKLIFTTGFNINNNWQIDVSQVRCHVEFSMKLEFNLKMKL